MSLNAGCSSISLHHLAGQECQLISLSGAVWSSGMSYLSVVWQKIFASLATSRELYELIILLGTFEEVDTCPYFDTGDRSPE